MLDRILVSVPFLRRRSQTSSNQKIRVNPVPALTEFLKVTAAWRLNDYEARQLFGISRGVHRQLKKGRHTSIARDQSCTHFSPNGSLQRLACTLWQQAGRRMDPATQYESHFWRGTAPGLHVGRRDRRGRQSQGVCGLLVRLLIPEVRTYRPALFS